MSEYLPGCQIFLFQNFVIFVLILGAIRLDVFTEWFIIVLTVNFAEFVSDHLLQKKLFCIINKN